MKVYVIEKGYYSDRHVVGVVETEEEAKKICEMFRQETRYDNDSAGYDVYDTKQFTISTMRFTVNTYYNDENASDWEVEFDDYNLYNSYKENSEVYDGFYVVYANSPNQAIKIAQDMRAEKLARENGLI